MLKTMFPGSGNETQLERTAFDQSAKASSNTPATAPNFGSSLDEAISGMKQAYSGIAKQKQKLMTEQTKLELRKELMSNPAIKELIAMRGELASKVQTSPTKIQGRADVNPLAQGRLQGGDIGALVQSMSDVSGDIQTRGTGILDVLNSEQKGRQQEYDIAKDQYDASRGMVSDIMNVGRYKMDEQLQPGKLTAQQLDNIAKNQEISGTKPLTPDQIISIYDSSNPQAIATYFADRGNEPKGTIPLIGGVAGNPATTGYKFNDKSKYTGKQHGAIDFRAQTPQPLSMPMDLTVVGDPVQGQQGGLTMRLKDAAGYTYTAMHLSDASKFKNGDTVPAGSVFAVTGDSGEYVDGAHLHWEMRDPSGKLVDATRTTSPAMTAIGKLMNSSSTTDKKITPGQEARLNGVINKYNSSPLMLASDRVPVLEGSIKSIRKDPGNAAQQLNLVYAYVQALDTYQSAVREGELNLVNSIDSKIGELAGNVQKVQRGQIVRPEVAKQIADAAESIVKTIKDAAREKSKSFQAQANVLGVGKQFTNYQSQFTPSYNKGTGQDSSGDLQEIEVIDGTTYVRQADGNYIEQ